MRISGWMQVTKTILVLAICNLCVTGLVGQSPAYGKISRMFLDAHAPDQPVKYRSRDIKKMIQNAKNAEDFIRLANYFDYQALEFQQKTRKQVAELQQLAAQFYHSRSYATQLEGTRELIKQYRTKANECSARSDSYRRRAAESDQTQ